MPKILRRRSMILFLFMAVTGTGYSYANEISKEDICIHLMAQRGLIKDLKFKEERGPLGWWSVMYKDSDIVRSDSSDGDISIRIADVGYYYSPSRKELRLQKWTNAFFFCDDIIYELNHGDIELTGKEKINSSWAYVIEGNFGAKSKYSHFTQGKIKVWIDSNKWIILKAEISDEGEGFKEMYVVNEIQLIDDKYWFPVEIIKTTKFEKYPSLGHTESMRKFKDVQINVGISDEMFNLKLPKKTDITMKELINSLSLNPISPK